MLCTWAECRYQWHHPSLGHVHVHVGSAAAAPARLEDSHRRAQRSQHQQRAAQTHTQANTEDEVLLVVHGISGGLGERAQVGRAARASTSVSAQQGGRVGVREQADDAVVGLLRVAVGEAEGHDLAHGLARHQRRLQQRAPVAALHGRHLRRLRRADELETLLHAALDEQLVAVRLLVVMRVAGQHLAAASGGSGRSGVGGGAVSAVLEAHCGLVLAQLVEGDGDGGGEHVPQQALGAGRGGQAALVADVGQVLWQQGADINGGASGQVDYLALAQRHGGPDGVERGVVVVGQREHDAHHGEAAASGAAGQVRLRHVVHDVHLQRVERAVHRVLAVRVEVELEGRCLHCLGARVVGRAHAQHVGHHPARRGHGHVRGQHARCPLHLDGVPVVEHLGAGAVGGDFTILHGGAVLGHTQLHRLSQMGQVEGRLAAASLAGARPVISSKAIVPGSRWVRLWLQRISGIAKELNATLYVCCKHQDGCDPSMRIPSHRSRHT
mmetsp:Transcript_24602/g.62502  ORF Transcript_24602/g.62502 Transcript_24602/m.62502 type:complete len:497 (-) Transcript_24602:24-1514(-)